MRLILPDNIIAYLLFFRNHLLLLIHLAGDNSKIKYALTSSAGGRFQIDPVTGMILTTMKLNREAETKIFKVD